LATSRLAVNVFAMSYQQDENNDAVVLNVTDYAVVADSIAPKTLLVTTKRLTELARVGGRLNVFS
jgi:hypothetical protein